MVVTWEPEPLEQKITCQSISTTDLITSNRNRLYCWSQWTPLLLLFLLLLLWTGREMIPMTQLPGHWWSLLLLVSTIRITSHRLIELEGQQSKRWKSIDSYKKTHREAEEKEEFTRFPIMTFILFKCLATISSRGAPQSLGPATIKTSTWSDSDYRVSLLYIQCSQISSGVLGMQSITHSVYRHRRRCLLSLAWDHN